MAQETVTGTPVKVTFERTSQPVVQNLGPSPLFWTRKAGVTDANGVKVAVGDTIRWRDALVESGGDSIHMVAGDDGGGTFSCDVRLDPTPREVV